MTLSVWDPISRRRFLRLGALGSLALGLPPLTSSAKTGTSQKDISCIFIVLSGGVSHIDTFDPKPDAPREVRGPYRAVPTSLPGTYFSEMLPLLAKQAHRFCLIRSLSHTEVPHVSAAHMMLTGQMDGSRKDVTPFMGSLISRFKPSRKNLPSYVWLHNMKTGTNKIPRYNNGLHLIGHDHAPLRIGYELDNPTKPGFRVRAFDPGEGMTLERLDSRMALLNHLEKGQPLGSRAEQFDELQQRAHDLLRKPLARRAFDLNQEATRLRERYGNHPLGQYCLMARRLVESGTRLVTVTGWPGMAPGEKKPTVTQVWDSHDIRYKGNDSMFGNGPFGLKWSLPRLDQAVSALLEDLQQQGMLKQTLVVVLTEFGRTPKFEGKGRGRGHWPHCYTGLLAGGGIKSGFIYGSSDKQGAYVAGGRPVSPEDFGATLFKALGMPLDRRYGPDQFSFRISNGKPLSEIFA